MLDGCEEGPIEPVVLTSVMGLILFGDAARVDDPFIQTFDYHRWSAPDPNIQYLQQRLDDPEPWRLLSMVQAGQDVMPGMYGIELAGGHHPNDLGAYRELIGMVGGGQPNNLLANPRLLSLLNVRYLLWPVAQLGDQVQGIQPVSQVNLADGRVYTALYELPALPRARVVGPARLVEDAQMVAALMDPSFDPASEVLFTAPGEGEASDVASGGAPISGQVTWVERGINASTLQVESSGDGFLVIADNWFPRWGATVNGADAPVLKAYHSLRAIPISAGSSTVVMSYQPAGVLRALWISLGCLALAVGMVGYGVWARRASRASAD